eukprot:1591516-Pyramimonas_sp.AAC.1
MPQCAPNLGSPQLPRQTLYNSPGPGQDSHQKHPAVNHDGPLLHCSSLKRERRREPQLRPRRPTAVQDTAKIAPVHCARRQS